MPSVGTRPVVSSRRSTRVFVPKSGSALRSDQLSPVSTSRFHSTKRENADSDWPCLSSAWNKENIENTTVANGHGPASVGEGERPSGVHSEERDDKTVDIVYKRKRPRQKAESSNSNNGENKRFGIVFSRQKRNKRSKLTSLDHNDGNGLTVLENGRTHETPREEENKLARLVMIARVDSSSNSSRIFLGFLLSILRWMRRNSRARIQKLIALLMNGPIARVFSMHGVQLSSMHEGKNDVVPGNYVQPHLGFCKLYSSSNSIPILSQSFSCLPSFFISLNLTVSLCSLYISPFLKNPSSSLDNDDNDIYFNPPITIQTSSKPKNHSSPIPEPSRILRSSSSFKQNQQKKRTASNRNNSIRLKTYFSLNSHRPKPLELPPDESSQSGMDSDVSTPRGKNRRSSSSSLKSPVMRVQERLALAEAKQNIDSVRCKANILVTLEDRCYREDDVILSIEHSSESDDWLICVTLQDNSKFKHKPSEMRPCVVNRYTHAYMWTVDDVMRLEFIEKFDWLLFKELHAECRLRNSLSSSSAQVKVKEAKSVQIPIPGVVEVEGYEAESRLDRPFVLPESYIRVLGDEVERAIGKKSSIYEADSGDERWIDGFNGEGIVRVSLEEFEWLVSLFEKDAYVNNGSNNGDGENSEYNVGEIDGVINRCKELERGDADVVAAVYDYWMKKRGTKGGAPLIRCFQGGRTRRVEWCQKPYLKKKRSFKRQRSQVTRVKSEPFFHDWAEEEAMRRLNEARAAANRAVQVAIQMRTRAQNIMEQADLAMYRAHMSYRIADAKSRLSRTVANPDPDFDPFPLL